VRTLDIGGDKSVDYLGITQEPNPFLGWRGIRMIDEKPELLRDQFYALLKAGQGSDLRIMLPMVARLEEILRARELMDEALVAIRQEMTDYTVKLQFGIMVEVPAAALMVEHFAPHVDFYSIGTNDLTQYTLAVDRMNARVAGLASPFDPAVLKLIERTIRVAHENQRWVGMCGEFAGEPLAVPFLIGVGLDEFSMAPASVPGIKSLLRKLSRSNCLAIAQDVLKLPTADSVRTYLEDVLKRI
jgi:phosphoenolpyruvate-protein kinase (PTS system EI component)